MPVVIAGTKSDARTIAPLLEELKMTAPTDVSGRLNLAEHTTLISMSQTVLSMDSSHAHIAGALGVPAVVILGGGHPGFFCAMGRIKNIPLADPSTPVFWLPLGLYLRPSFVHTRYSTGTNSKKSFGNTARTLIGFGGDFYSCRGLCL